MTPLRSRMISLARSRPARAERVSARRFAVSMAAAARGGEGAEQGDLLAFEDAGAPVRGEEHADDVVAEHEGHAEDGDQALVAYARVDGAGVLEAGVLEVVVGDVGAGGLGDEAAEPLPHAEPQLLEAGRDRALGDAHVGVAAGGVVEAEVGHVGAEQRAGPLHDRAQDRVQVAQTGEVVGRLEQCGQLGLTPAPALQFRAHAQGEVPRLFERGDPLGRYALGAGEQHRLLVGVGGRAPGQQLQERRLDGGGRALGIAGVADRRSGVVGGALGGLDVIAGHAHRIPHRTVVPAALWKTPDAEGTTRLGGRVGPPPGQCAVQPPSRTNEVPVTKDACGPHR